MDIAMHAANMARFATASLALLGSAAGYVPARVIDTHVHNSDMNLTMVSYTCESNGAVNPAPSQRCALWRLHC